MGHGCGADNMPGRPKFANTKSETIAEVDASGDAHGHMGSGTASPSSRGTDPVQPWLARAAARMLGLGAHSTFADRCVGTKMRHLADRGVDARAAAQAAAVQMDVGG